uniref:Ig-like domain-containing protein n=1 Tax=Lates calcarifer TaxID=8187 RepID=A0A4W6CFU0_LATCA
MFDSSCEHQTKHNSQNHSQLLHPERLTAGNSISPVGGVVSGTEGQSVTLRCDYETSYDRFYLNWYRHHSDLQAPQFILLSVEVSEEKTRMDLQISSAAVTDSAVYYCAVRPTVTGNTTTLYKNLWSKDNTILHNIH